MNKVLVFVPLKRLALAQSFCVCVCVFFLHVGDTLEIQCV